MSKDEKEKHAQIVRSAMLTMAMTILDSKIERDVATQKLLTPGRQSKVDSYTTEEVCEEASKLVKFIMGKSS